MNRSRFDFAEKFLAVQCGWITILLLAHFISQSYSVLISSGRESSIGSFAILNLDNEANLPAWYSACALFLCAVLAGIISYSKWNERNSSRYKWAGLGILFSYLSLDESASLHEGVIPGFLQKVGFNVTQGGTYDWTPIGMSAFAVVFFLYLRFWIKLPSKTRLLFAISAATFLMGAVGFEKISHFYEALYQTENTLAYVLTAGIEEFLEMLGVALFNYALLSYICERIGFIRVSAISSQEKIPVKEMATQKLASRTR